MLMSEYLASWLVLQEYRLSRSTYEAYSIYINKHLIPYFAEKGLLLEAIKPQIIKEYLLCASKHGNMANGKGLSTQSLRKHLNILKQVLNDAVAEGLIQTNPSNVVKTKRVEAVSSRTVFIQEEEAQRLLNCSRSSPYGLAILFGLVFGLRRSEVLGLRWQSIDFKNKTFIINHTVVKNLTISAKDETKTKESKRTFNMSDMICDYCVQHREAYENAVKAGLQAPSEYLFCRANGEPMRPDTLTRGFQRLLKKNGFQKMRFHDLRHSCVSLLLDRGTPMDDVREYARHSDIETTMNIYAHYNETRKPLVCKEMFEILGL